MIRKVYFHFIKNKITKGQLPWIFKRAWQYFLIHASFILGRPLCGPILGTFVATYKCNYRCRMCNLPQLDEDLCKKGLPELSTAQLKRLLKDFAELGTSGIGFTGGEPMLHPDIFELLRYTKELGMITHLNTNGFFLDENNAQRLLDAGCDSLNISLDAACAETHDAIRGFRGAFDKAVQAVRNVNRLRKKERHPIRIKVVTVINEMNIDEITDLLILAQELQVDCIEFIPEQPFVEEGKRKAAFDGAFLEKVKKTVKFLLEFKQDKIRIENSPRHLKLFERSFKGEKSPLVCFAGYNSYGVDCFGQIFPCMSRINWQEPAANVRDVGFKQFWYSKEYNKMRKQISQCKDCFLNCQAELNLLFSIHPK